MAEASSIRQPCGGTKRQVLCRCDCGVQSIVQLNHLVTGETSSCGCLMGKGRITHGMSKSRAYGIWSKMKDGCGNPNNSNYKDYGGRGITVCDEWSSSFEKFLNDMGQPATANHSIERIDNSLGYAKENCRWADALEQGRNKRNNITLTHNGISKTMSDWSREIGISVSTIWRRVQLGWNHSRIVNTPLRSQIISSRVCEG